MELEYYWFWASLGTLVALYILMRRLNEWYYGLKLGNKRHSLPPGHMGWPLLGNSLAFFKDFSCGRPDSFIDNLVSKYGKSGIYKTHLFGNPSIIVCKPETCRKVLTDDENFNKHGYPKSTSLLLGCKPLNDLSTVEHKHFRRLVTTPIIGYSVLEMYIKRIEKIVIDSLEELSSMKHEPIELLKEMKKLSFKVIIHIFMGSQNHSVTKKMGDSFTILYNALFSIPIDAPGFAFHKALKARKKLVKILESVVEERKLMIKNGKMRDQKDLIDILLHLNGEKGQNFEDEHIIDVLIAFLLVGHETTASGMMWSIIYLTRHPQVWKKAKEEQEEIIKTRPPSQKQLSLQEIKQMVCLSQVINETLRLANITFSAIREATSDVKINGYIIPKGWNVFIWFRALHMDPENYLNPEEFNPSRWDDYKAKEGTFLPFGAGTRLCPGSNLAKLEISIFLHYFLLNYKLEEINPECRVTSLPSTKPIDNCLARVIKVSADPMQVDGEKSSF